MRLFTWLRRHRATINGVLITVFTSLIFNTISDSNGNLFRDYKRVFAQIFRIQTLSDVLTAASLVCLIIYNIIISVWIYLLNRKSVSSEFFDLMKLNTSPHLVNSIGNGCISWGEGKTVEICSDIIFGWTPNNILVENYENELYRFYQSEEQDNHFGIKSYYFNESDYSDFKNSEAFKNVIRKGNNLPRVMLKDSTKNYDKKDRKLLVSLGRTEWSQTSYIWDRFGKSIGNEVDSNSLMNEYSLGITSGNESEPYLPNSFCMHLLIETMDNKVILSRISQMKINDNPGTWAATLGEQLDIEDFTDGNNLFDGFVINWMRRAFKEEYKFDEKIYSDIVDEDSLKVLSVDFESDRYNFALLCTVQLRYTFEAFNKKVAPILSTEEAIELKAIKLSEIPYILLTYNDEEERKQYHPSTYLRLLVFIMHKYGYAKAERMVMNSR